MAFPDDDDLPANASSSEFLSVMHDGEGHVTATNRVLAALLALFNKLGLTASLPARGKALVGSSDGNSKWDTAARPNLLLNGDFRVWQRGTASPTTSDNGYGPDRWRLLLEAANAATIDRETSDLPSDGGPAACKLTVGSGEDNKFGIWEVLENADVQHLRGKKVSLQCKLKATAGITDVRMAVVEFTGTADSVSGDPISSWGSAGTNPTLAANYAYLGTPANLSPTTSWATYRVEGLTVGASATNLAVFVWCDDETTTQTTDILRIADVQLEEGEVCTAVSRRPLAAELACCQYYFNRLVSGNGIEVAAGRSGATNSGEVVIHYPRMRTLPTLSASAASHFSADDAANATLNSISFDQTGQTSCRANVGQAGSTWTTGRGMVMRTISASATLDASAEL